MSKTDQPRSKSASLADRIPWYGSKKDDADDDIPYPNPVKIAATWTPDTLVQSGRVPTRGFGGRIFFYDEKSRPVPVEGTLIVHGFDEEIEDPQKSVKRFEFTPEQFTKHFSKTDLGASYSVWIPWDAMGGDRKRISLVASFKTAEGKAVQGVPAMVLLPGKQRPETAEEKLSKLSPQYRQYQNALAMDDSTRQSGLTTTTIQRRRGIDRPATPSINPPAGLPVESDKTMLAAASRTPSVEISMNRRLPSSDILPASAEITNGARLPAVRHSFQR
ncbi:MAG: hypothetical protein WBD20_21285 [Pirellulaceae bacterium]